MLSNSDQKILAQDVKSDMDKVLSKMKKARGKSERFHLGKEMKQLRKELRDREKRAMKETLIRWLHCNHRDSGAFLKVINQIIKSGLIINIKSMLNNHSNFEWLTNKKAGFRF